MKKWIGIAVAFLLTHRTFSQTLPDAATLFENAAVLETIEKNSGKTDALKALRQTGTESLFDPGRRAVDAAYSKDDPTSQAVVTVDRGLADRPTVDADPGGFVSEELEAIKKGASEKFPDLENVAAVGACRPASIRVSGDQTTRTCDIRTHESASEYMEKHCSIQLLDLTRHESRFRCSVTSIQEKVFELAIPVIPTYTTTTTLTCLEGKRNAQTAVCTVTYGSTSRERYEAFCVRPLYKTERKVCTKALRVKPVATCTPGTVTRARVHDAGILSEDAVPGADTFEVAYVCGKSERPAVRLGVNTQKAGDVDFFVETADSVIDIVRIVGGNTLRFTGSLSCENDACTAPVTVSVFHLSGESRVYSGSLQTTLFFNRFAVTSETEYWEESCKID